MINVVADLYPYESGWSQLQARMLLKQGKKKEALATCERATETETPALEIYLMMSELLTEETRTIENRLVLTRSMGLFPEEESRQRILQQCLRTGEYSLAQILYSQLRQTKEFALRRLFYDLAPGQLFAFLASYPNEIPVELLLTSAEVKQSIRQYAEAAKTFERVLQQDPVNRRALLGMGKLHLDKAEFDQAEAMFRKALSSGNVEAHEWLGKLDYLKGNFAKASQRILAGIKNSGPSAGLLQLAALLKLRQGDYQGVKKTVEQAFKSGIRLSGFILDQLNPEDFQQTAQMDGNFGDLDELVIRFRLGKILQDQGKIAAAKAEYQRVLAIQPQLNRIHFHLAECLLLEGKTVEALLKMRSSLDSALDLASAEERDLVLDSPYPCLTTILTGSAIISGDFPRAQELLLSQLEGFQKGTTDLVTDTDLMRGDVTFYPYFQQYFRINPPSVKCHELAKSLVILRNKGEITEESLKKLQIDSLVKEYLQVWLMMEKGQTKEAFIQLKKTLEADQLLEKLRLLMGVLFLFFH
jgi:tetratricopeptide (TPR) repeat protein